MIKLWKRIIIKHINQNFIKLIFNLFWMLSASFFKFWIFDNYSLYLLVLKTDFKDKIFLDVLGNKASFINLF
jgi:hypothetical protein